MTDDRAEMQAARAAGLQKRHEQRLENATYTAAEVKVLTEKAREETAKEIYEAIKKRRDEAHDARQPGWPLLTEAMVLAGDLGSKEASA